MGHVDCEKSCSQRSPRDAQWHKVWEHYWKCNGHHIMMFIHSAEYMKSSLLVLQWYLLYSDKDGGPLMFSRGMKDNTNLGSRGSRRFAINDWWVRFSLQQSKIVKIASYLKIVIGICRQGFTGRQVKCWAATEFGWLCSNDHHNIIIPQHFCPGLPACTLISPWEHGFWMPVWQETSGLSKKNSKDPLTMMHS